MSEPAPFLPLRNARSLLPLGDLNLPEEGAFLDYIGIEDLTVEINEGEGTITFRTKIIFIDKIAITFPGIEDLAFVIAPDEGRASFDISLCLGQGFTVSVLDLKSRIRIPPTLLVKAVASGDGAWERDESAPYEINLPPTSMSLDQDLNIKFEAAAGVSLEPAFVGNTGVIIEMADLTVNLRGDGSRPENAPDDWKGLYIGTAKVYIPDLMQGHIEAEGLGIGTGGFYGRIEYSDGDIEGEVLGMEGSITSIALEFVQSIPVEFDIQGKILFPFFDEPVDVSIGVDIDGDFQLTLADTDEDGMFMLRKENILEAKLESISFEKKEDLFIASISGSIKPLVGGINWPEFDVEKLSIDSEGNVHIDGGWIDVPDKLTLTYAASRWKSLR